MRILPRSLRSPRWLLVTVLAVVALFQLLQSRQESPARESARVEVTAPAGMPGESARTFGASIGFRSPRHLADHFERHGAEFRAADASVYLAAAQALRDAPAVEPVLEAVRADGVVTRFDRTDGTFIAFDPDGIIRTCFRPNDGERYFRRQARRPAEGR